MNNFKAEERKDGGREGMEQGQDAEQLSRPTLPLNFSRNQL